MNVITLELRRRQLYNDILSRLEHILMPTMRSKEVRHLLLRYVFNRNIEKTATDDPIFISSSCPHADHQIERDLAYHKCDAILHVSWLNREFVNAAKSISNDIKDNKIDKDSTVHIATGIITYNHERYPDYASLTHRYPTLRNYALALIIRYTYLGLWRHGLARDYESMKYNRSDAFEGFATAFNRYFNNYCSAFPDLESVFGSQGSFFDIKDYSNLSSIIYVNPPWDEHIIMLAGSKVLKYCDKRDSKEKTQRFIFTLPDWKDFPIIKELCGSRYCVNFIVYERNRLRFLDYMPIMDRCTNNTIVPRGENNINTIIEITLQHPNI